MFTPPIFTELDNEARVRESLVAPLLRSLGYAEEDIQVEYPLGFRDQIPLRADYVVSVEHEFGLPPNRLVVEAKRPNTNLKSPEILNQTAYYASHRSVQASHVVTVNGFELNVYEAKGVDTTLLKSFDTQRLKESWGELAELISAAQLRRYFAGTQLTEMLGAGGYGRVFKCWNNRLKRFEALKVLHPGSETLASLLARFEKGAQGLAALDHPYICRVHDVSVFRGRPYYRMEFVEGVAITNYVEQTALNRNERIDLFRKICEGLSHAHKHQVVHCDLKPANVLVKKDGTPKLIDFDFCHIGDNSSTTLSQIIATIAYMDPTIWQNPKNRDVLADIYSSGLLLWSTLTGKELIPGWSPLSLVQSLSSIDDSERFAHVILGCLQENRSLRPRTMDDLLKHLEVMDWHLPVQGKLAGATSNFAMSSPLREFEYYFQLWQQTGRQALPVSINFDRISKNVPNRALTEAEQEFVFRAACEHWSEKYRSMFKTWKVDDLMKCAEIVIGDPEVLEAGKGKIAETTPARKALAILTSVDDYLDARDSERIARFILSVLQKGKLKTLFFTALDDLARLQCLKGKNTKLRVDVSRALIELIRSRLPKSRRDTVKQIGKLLEKLDPWKCGADNQEVAVFLGEVAKDAFLFDRAVATLVCLENPHATDCLIQILDRTKGTQQFESTALKALGVGGRHKRPTVAKYLSEGSFNLSVDLQRAVAQVLTPKT
jgi:serine/threonine protein kinase